MQGLITKKMCFGGGLWTLRIIMFPRQMLLAGSVHLWAGALLSMVLLVVQRFRLHQQGFVGIRVGQDRPQHGPALPPLPLVEVGVG